MITYISDLSLPRQHSWPRRTVVMGSTGSIGVNTLDVMERQPERFCVTALAGARNVTLLAKQATRHRPPHLAVLDESSRADLAALLPAGYAPTIHCGPQGYAAIASLDEADLVVSAQVGAAGLAATHAAVRNGKTVALANKESLVLAGGLLRDLAQKTHALILPVDSEHNAIFQCLAGQEHSSVQRIILTASGGPFRGKTASFLESVTPTMALAHPNWCMGAKISIDSATMMNKGLEIIEACHLYGLPLNHIDVLVHPQSIIHSLVEFSDASLLAQAGPPDMRMAIAHCLGWPERLASGIPPMDLAAIAALTFEKPDLSVFRCLALAREAFRFGKGMPVVLNAANEIAVDAFLSGRIPFQGIAACVEKAMERHAATARHEPESLEAIVNLDETTRRTTTEAHNISSAPLQQKR